MKKTSLLKLVFVNLLLINIALVAGYLLLRQQLGYYDRGRLFPAVAGADLRGRAWEAGESTCYVIRVTADDCPYCREDAPLFSEIADAALNEDCSVVSIAPRAGEMAEVSGKVQQLKYISMDLGGLLNPFITPQTIVLDAERRLEWSIIGAMDTRKQRRALGVIEELGSADPY